MLGIPSETASFFRPDDKALSREGTAQVQLHRLLSLLGAALIFLFGLLFEVSNPGAVDPVWDHLVVAGLFAGLLLASYVSGEVRRRYVSVFWGLLYLVMAWLTAMAVLNRFAGDYVLILLLAYAALGIAVALGAQSFWPVVGFLGAGFLFVAGGVVLTPEPEASPSILLASMATVALVVEISLHGQLSVQKRLEERERQLFAIAENVSEGIYRSTPDKGLTYVNRAFAEMLRFDSRDELLEVDPTTLYATPKERERLRAAAREQDSFNGVEAEFRRKDGTTFTGLLSGTVVRGQEGEVKCYDGAVTDITERKRMEEKLREREARIRGLANSIPGAVFQFYARPDGTYGHHFVSEHAEEVLGISADPEGFQERVVERVPASHREELVESIDQAVEERAFWEFETPFEKPSGERVWLWGASVPEQREEELVFNGVILDITQRKEAERRLREERDRLETLFESLPSPVVRCELREEGTLIADVNREFEEVFGTSSSEAIGQDIDELIVPEERREEAARLAIEALEEGPQEEEVRRKTASGLRDFRLQAAGRSREEAPPEVYVIYTDITDRKRREEALREAKQEAESAQAEAERANRLKSAFLANVSHEIRTPLTSIIGFAEAIGEEASGLEGCAQNGELSSLSRFSRLIEQSGHRLLDTLDAVLRLSKLEAGEAQLDAKPINLAAEMEKTAEQLRPKAEEAGLSLQASAETAPLWASADEGGLQVVLSNLAENAIKYTEEGGEVRLRAGEEDEAVFLEVEDTGIGMDPGQVKELFDPFRQESEGTSREYEGTGLGLAVTTRAVEQMDGRVEVETEKGEGTCFTVWLPSAN